MIAGSLARRYARALMEIGEEQKNLEKLGREVADLAEAMKISPELSETLSNPAFRRADRQKVLEALLKRLGAGKMMTNFSLLLLERDRLSTVPDIARELGAMIDERAGRVNAVVRAAVPLDAVQTRKLQTALESLSGKKVALTTEHDPSLLGGIVARVGDVEYDGSLKSQIERLRERAA